LPDQRYSRSTKSHRSPSSTSSGCSRSDNLGGTGGGGGLPKFTTDVSPDTMLFARSVPVDGGGVAAKPQLGDTQHMAARKESFREEVPLCVIFCFC
jgi:hypothetical protein